MSRPVRWIMFLLMATGLATAEERGTPLPTPARPAMPPPAAQKRVLAMSVAGSWYPADAGELSRLIDRLYADVGPSPLSPGDGPVRALLVPHATYRFSGQTAAAAFKLVQGRPFRRVVVLGDAHRLTFGGLAVTDATHLVTPLGEVAVDTEAVARLASNPLANYIPRAFQGEHSVETQLPFLQQALSPGWRVVPVLVGNLNTEGFAKAADLIRPLLDATTLLVISGDFTRYGPNYKYLPFPKDDRLAANLRDLDMGAWEKVKQRDLEGLIQYRQKTRLNACAFGPLAAFLNIMPPETRSILVHYDTSNTVNTDPTHSVSYLSSVFTHADPFFVVRQQQEISEESRPWLHRLANKALALAVRQGPAAVIPDHLIRDLSLPATFKDASAVFVTLRKEGELRGSIGDIEPVTPLYRAVIESAVRAAHFDKRFPPVTLEELAGLELEISILGPLRKIHTLEEIQLGHHGLVLTKAGRRALFLPEEAVQQKWDLEETLNHLAQHAGLAEDAWREGATLEVFTTRLYAAPYQDE